MNVEEGIICEINGNKAKVKVGRNRIREVKINPEDNFKVGDCIKILMGIAVCKA